MWHGKGSRKRPYPLGGTPEADHVSETALDGAEFDLLINNNLDNTWAAVQPRIAELMASAVDSVVTLLQPGVADDLQAYPDFKGLGDGTPSAR
jgi:hypothetical protein